MKLYHKTTKRLAKKQIGHDWRILNLARHLKVGDLISSCKGYNERIAEVYPVWSRSGYFIYDFDIVTQSGSSCSIIHCCTLPIWTKQEVVDRWRPYSTPEGKRWAEGIWKPDWHYWKVIEGVKNGLDVFDEDGQLTYDFAPEYERIARFGE